MKQVKIFRTSYTYELEDVVNNWLRANSELEVVDIKIAEGHVAMVIYVQKEPQ